MDQFDWLKERIERIENKVDTIQEHCHNIDKTLTKNTADIAVHIKRTDLAEQNLAAVRVEIKPISKHVTMVEGVFKFIGFLALLAGLIISINEIF